jgi:two-component system, chemotaxis family, protein-glutamate methylesterase/glutaminase
MPQQRLPSDTEEVLHGHDIIVVGASAGGVEALVTLVRALPPHLPAALFVVLHLSGRCPSRLPHILSRSGQLEALHPTDGAPIAHGSIDVAPPNRHLLVECGQVRVVDSPKQNHHRPAIDPLFRSAALAYGSRVVGVILSGALYDGTVGLLCVKQGGGVAIVQDPEEAPFPEMPRSALAQVEVDYTLPLSRIAPMLIRLAHKQVNALDTPLARSIPLWEERKADKRT